MIQDTVTIDLEKYEELKKLREETLNGKKIVITTYHAHMTGYEDIEYFTDSEIIKDLANKNEKQSQEIEELLRSEKLFRDRSHELEKDLNKEKNKTAIGHITNIIDLLRLWHKERNKTKN